MTLLTALEDRGILSAATIRLARHLGYLYAEENDLVIASAAAAITALSAGSVCFELDHPEQLHSDQGCEDPLPWPPPDEWLTALRASPLVSTEPSARDKPLILDQSSVYLTRSWAEQDGILTWIKQRLTTTVPYEESHLAVYFTGSFELALDAARLAASSRFSVIGGGPGTGKTTIVARILAGMAHGRTIPLRVILAAPTGRAAACLEQAVAENLAVCETLDAANFSLHRTQGTIHRILGLKPWGGADHDSSRPLPADVIVVDEASMLSLHLMAQLLDAVAESTQVILLGDPDQLASVEAGAVLGDLVSEESPVPVARLSHTYRFGGAIADLAQAIRIGDTQSALSIMKQETPQIEWIAADAGSATPGELARLRHDMTTQGLALLEMGRHGQSLEALETLESHRLLLAHRHGLSGVSYWTALIRQWLCDETHEVLPHHWYPGMPVLITANDRLMDVYNGDSGVIISDQGSLRLAIPDTQGVRLLAPDMITSLEPLYASTIHKAQGSQYERVSLILPRSSTALLSRELFYTGVTRAKSFLRIIGTEEAIRHAITTEALRASGLSQKLADHTRRK
ncbi:MAG: exodeoxyribonuclease V subunit alpha [Propionibacteriaceae bacterium]|nr:exodeoxyribonuclease V subunit alpha [Propionibacteriaceae bacterium]